MKIIRKKEAVHHTARLAKGAEGRRYYLPPRDPLEVIETVMPPGLSQPPHAHRCIREATLVLEGRVIVAEILNGIRNEQQLSVGDMVVFNPRSCHCMENRSRNRARTLTFKFVGEEKDANLFRGDKFENCTGPLEKNPNGPSESAGLVLK